MVAPPLSRPLLARQDGDFPGEELGARFVPTPPSSLHRLSALLGSSSSRILLLTLLPQSPHCIRQSLRRRREFRSHALQQRAAILVTLGAVMYAEMRRTLRRTAPQADSRVLPVLAQNVI